MAYVCAPDVYSRRATLLVPRLQYSARPFSRTDAASGSSAVVLVAACGGHDADSGKGSWQFKVDTTRSAAGARVTAWLRVAGKEHPEGAAETKPVILSFDCFPDNAISTIMTDQALRQGSAEARVTVDSGSRRRIPGFAGTTASGGQLVLTIPQDSMLALLSGHQHAVSSMTTARDLQDGRRVSHRRPRAVPTDFLKVCAETKAR